MRNSFSPHTTASNSSSPIEKFFWATFSYWLVNAVGQIVSSFCFCHKVIPSPVGLALADTILSRSLAKCAKHGNSVLFFSISLKFFSFPSVQFHSDFFPSSCLIRLVFFESMRKNFALYCIPPRNDFNSVHDVGGLNCNIAYIFSFFGFIPWSDIS